ncbi:hypothetical protein [uncultured Jatrophihabitans sp.]|uniref:hypothetical protein n=1 Tax=uncultured Jatrophihabitans sp. TaxID=1610747 RepID=UPI0035CAE254
MREYSAADDDRPTPGLVTGAVSIGTAPLPFLAVYTLLFLGHGLIHPVHPPDITTTQGGEVIAGCVTGVLFIALLVAIIWFVNGSRRWPFAVLQVAVAAAGCYFLIDGTKGGPAVSVLLILAAVVALVLAFAPAAWRHVERRAPRLVHVGYGKVGLGEHDDTVTGYSTAR